MNDKLIFLDAHVPAVPAGTYDVTITQWLKDQPKSGSPRPPRTLPTLKRTARFHVQGPRVALQPGWIESRFPPPSSNGDHANVLPHVVLNRSALPWERKPGDVEDSPWLAVLLFEDDEFADLGTNGAPLAELSVPVKALRSPTRSPSFPGLGDDRGLEDDDPVSVLDVPRDLLSRVMPKGPWLRYLAHVRERSIATLNDAGIGDLLDAQSLDALVEPLGDAGVHLSSQARITVDIRGSEWRIEDPATDILFYVERTRTGALRVADEARAVVMSSRLTRIGKQYRAFLVSIEGRFDAAGEFDYGSATGADPVRLVVLDRWAFSVSTDAGHLEALLKGLVLEDSEDPSGPYKPLHLAIPSQERDGDGVPMLNAGYAPLRHRLRNGGETWSWYRGPLVRRIEPGTPPEAVVHASDQLLVRDVNNGLLDTSYAAAWELGRHLTLANVKVALEIVRWKTQSIYAQHRGSDAHVAAAGHIFGAPVTGSTTPVPPQVEAWLERLALLDGLPFDYLVPDPSMLPMESLRVFHVDPRWQTCLIDGALSAGRLPGASAEEERTWERDARDAVKAGLGDTNKAPVAITGCLIRSEAISGWPGLIVDGYAASPQGGNPDRALRVLRRAKLSDNVLLALYRGVVKRVDIHPNPEALHHGVDVDDQFPWQTPLRTAHGVQIGARELTVDPVTRVLDIGMASTDKTGAPIPPELLAIELIAGVPRLQVKLSW